MPMSEYVRRLRAAMGPQRLLLPSVSTLVYDGEGRLLLVRQRDGNAWSTPGGAIEFDETPADAAVRETWEETGLLVSPTRIFGVYGGPNFVVHYENGDEAQYVMVAMECAILSGALHGDGDETIDVRFWGAGENPKLAPWLKSMFPVFLARAAGPFLEPPTWSPPA
ncbi:MAG: NUDIX domain-containing protein [Rhizomicrobium sp.]|jgi:8-oxo-dGTP pyrophosphatase MutT (NUDIX family)